MSAGVIVRPSPNHGARRAGPVDILLFHYTGMASAAAALDWLTDPSSGVSAHYLIDEAGAIYALVDEDRRAWHAGEASWAGERDINSRSIGIEVHNRGHDGGLPPYPDKQIEALTRLARDMLARHPIPRARVLGHSDVAPGRKIDPGERFPWDRLAAAGIGLWSDPEPPDEVDVVGPATPCHAVADLQRGLAAAGYPLAPTGRYDDATATVVAAFQRHWRPGLVDGRADRSTRDQLAWLLAAARP